MGFLKAQWRMIVFAAVCLLSTGGIVWCFLGASDVEEKMKQVDGVRQSVKRLAAGPVNTSVIEEKRKEVEKRNAEIGGIMDAALAMQKYNVFYESLAPDGRIERKLREPVLPGVLPKILRDSDALAFKRAYEQEYARLAQRLHARDKAKQEEVSAEAALIEASKTRAQDIDADWDPWGPAPSAAGDAAPDAKKPKSLLELLREYASARAADNVAQKIYMYLSDNALAKHYLTDKTGAPNQVEIWHAQMSLWIQQDIATALARLNDRRADELRNAGRAADLWVAHMPVKHLVVLRIGNVLGRGGGSNGNIAFPSFTNVENNAQLFVVPLEMEVVVEEAAALDLLDSLTKVGFYTPVRVRYATVPPNPLQDTFIYGSSPVVRMTIAFEGYYFRKIYDAWIPDALKPILSTPGAIEKELM